MGEGEILNNNEKVLKRYYIYIIHSTERKMGLNVFLCEKRKNFRARTTKEMRRDLHVFFCHCFLLATAAVEFFKLWLITHTHSRRQTETHSTRTHTQYGDNKQTDTRTIFHFFLQIPLEKVKKKRKSG